ncbi:hypothetical protein [Longispora albida]|uniref:hypothetical protein n=1 Tax=Longispora albida TaxID=203523 RepID=UPI0003687E31|nr:hypothetical protein [Longispora albida]
MRRIILLLPLLAASCADPANTVAEGSYRNAVAVRSGKALADVGVPVRGRLHCTSTSPDNWSTVRTSCEGHTADGRPITVEGVAELASTPAPREQYVISVAGHIVVTLGGTR